VKVGTWIVGVLGGVLGACGGSAPCPAADVCGKFCCAAGSECVMDADAGESCGVICQKSGDCTGQTTCCQPVLDAEGQYAGNGVCAANPAIPGAYDCLCEVSSECGESAECVPDVRTPGVVTGPYICALNDGEQFDGCRGSMVFCTAQGEYCATDKAGNQFCSADCGSDSMCGNTGVACCNASCSKGKCCGLCGS
jgi:hypothetical protein